MVDDYVMYDLQMLLTRSKNVDWKKSVMTRANTLMSFFESNPGLLVGVELFDEHHNLKPDIVIRKSNLTDKGIIFWKKVRTSWEKHLDRGGDAANTEWLEKKSKKEKIFET